MAGFTYAILPLGAAGGTVLLGVLHGRWGEARMQRLYAWPGFDNRSAVALGAPPCRRDPKCYSALFREILSKFPKISAQSASEKKIELGGLLGPPPPGRS